MFTQMVPTALIGIVYWSNVNEPLNGADCTRGTPQTDMTPRSLADLLAGLTRERLLAMATKARALARPRAAARVSDEIERLVAA